MSETTPNLALPLIAAGQAQKHVTHNEALTGLDTLVQLACLDKDLTAPPASPAEGDRYLLAAANPTGAWAGLSGRIVRYQDGHWAAFAPRPGWLAWVVDEADLYAYSGGAWVGFRATLTALQNLARLGIGTTADAANPFAAKLNTALWTARTTAEGGTGDLRCTLNKQGAGNVLSPLFQSGFSGRAEIGLVGDDDLAFRVSDDGGTFREALRVRRSTGALAVPAGSAAAPSVAPAGDSDTGPFSPGPDLWGLTTGGTERLRVDAGGRLGLGTTSPRTALDTRLGTLSGAANDYNKAQATMSGGGTITWAGPGGALKWTSRFTFIPVSQTSAPQGFIEVTLPTTGSIPSPSVWDGTARQFTTSGVALAGWEALWAVHTPGGGTNAYTFRVTIFSSPFDAPSNWLLIAAVNGDDGTLKLGTGQVLKPGGSVTAGTDAQYVQAQATTPGGLQSGNIFLSGSGLFGGSVGVGTASPATKLAVAGAIAHASDNAYSFGTASSRATVVYAATGAINTSDAREKTEVAPLSEAETAAAGELARAIGTFRFRDALARKGDGARLHVGLTVQRALAIMETHGLDPFAYGIVCHDAWEAIEPMPAVPGREAERDDLGGVIVPAIPARPATPGRPAGDRYGFRTDELLLFLARGFEARLRALEGRDA